MSDLHTLYTNNQDVLRIVKYVHPTPSIDGHFILARDDKCCTVTLQAFLKDWKVFNSASAFADYLLYTDQLIFEIRPAETIGMSSTISWIKGRCLDAGKLWATQIKYSDLAGYF